jgi:regulator of protease activity HflC (stomatin/prohibitin superfamily)
MNIANFIQFLSTLFWLTFVGMLALVVVRASRQKPTKTVGTLAIVALVVAVLLTVVGAGLVFIEPYETGVVVTVLVEGGMRPEPLKAGLHWIVPFIERVERYPISRQTYTMARTASEGEIYGDDSVESRTSDGQRIFVDASVIYAIDPAKVLEVHRSWQKRYDIDLVRPQARGIVRDAVSQYRVEEAVSTKRFEMAVDITENLTKKFAENGLILIDFVMRDVTFTPEYAQSIEQKQIAEQQALQAKFVVESKRQEAEQARQVAQGQADAAVIAAKGEAEARLIQAEAEAKALEYIANVLRLNPSLLQYEYIQKLSPAINVMLLPSDNPFLLPLPTPQP